MPNLSIEPGIMALTVSMGARAVLANLNDRFLKGPNDEGETNLKLDVLAGNLGMSRSELHGHLQELSAGEYLNIDLSTIEAAGLLRIDRMKLSAAVVEDLFTAAESAESKILDFGKANRRKCGFEGFIHGDDRYSCEISEEGERFGVSVTRSFKEDGEHRKMLVYHSNVSLTPEEAWLSWDNFKAQFAPEEVADWSSVSNGHAKGLKVEEGGKKSGKKKGKKDAPARASNEEGEILGEKNPAENQNPIDFDITLEEGVVVHCTVVEKYTTQTDLFAFTGDKGSINEAGTWKKYVASADLLADGRSFEEYATAIAMEQRAKYLATVGQKAAV
jgi:hypothetical protein